MIRRREFILALGAAAAWPPVAHPQRSGRLPTAGFMGGTTALVGSQWATAFVQRLRELGWIENRTVAIEYRWAEGRDERFAEIAAEFTRLKVDVIVTYSTPSAIAAKKATAVIPIVIAGAGDLVGTGLVASLARPGGMTNAPDRKKTFRITHFLRRVVNLRPRPSQLNFVARHRHSRNGRSRNVTWACPITPA